MKVRMKVNGNPVEREIPEDRMLVDFIREDLGLTGTRKGCGEGECGACTIIMDGQPVVSCLIPVSFMQYGVRFIFHLGLI